MADRFPSLEEFDAGPLFSYPRTTLAMITDAFETGSTEIRDLPAGGGDGTSFLERERAALGDDADQFATPHDRLATVEDAGDDDLLAGGGAEYQAEGGEDITGFESSFPAIDTTNDVRGPFPHLHISLTMSQHMAPGGSVTGGATATAYPPPTFEEAEEEPAVIKEWRSKRDAAIARRDEISAAKKAETIRKAQQDIDDFYDEYNNKKEKGLAQTRRDADDFLAAVDDTTAGGTSWERIARLVDLSGKGPAGGASGTGKERFRELLLSLKKDEKAPGASGY